MTTSGRLAVIAPVPWTSKLAPFQTFVSFQREIGSGFLPGPVCPVGRPYFESIIDA
jgi:hypothetical protein